MPGVKNGHRSIKVRIPAGVSDGGKVRLRGQGVSAPTGGPPGDLVLTVRVREHPHFRRDGDDLHLTLPITPAEAYEGAKVKVPTLEGPVTLTIPSGTQSGATLRLRGKGAPKRKGGHGDLYVDVQIRLPEPGDEAVAEALRKVAEKLGDDVRAGIRL